MASASKANRGNKSKPGAPAPSSQAAAQAAGSQQNIQTRSQRAGLQFPIVRIRHYLTQRTQNIGTKSRRVPHRHPQVPHRRGPRARRQRVQRPAREAHHAAPSVARHPRRQEELDTLVRATIAGGGVLPFIHKSLSSNIKNAARKTGEGQPAQ